MEVSGADGLCERINALVCKCEGNDPTDANEGDVEHHGFIPLQSLYRLLTTKEIECAVARARAENEGEGVPFYHEIDTVNWIITKGKRIFAILAALGSQERLIPAFIEHDFQAVDEKLPFSLDLLQRIVPGIAQQFYDKQWEFVSPIWSRNVIHRELPPEIRLPFTYNHRIDAGGFGEIYEIRLHPDHQTIALLPGNGKIVRKEFKSALFERKPKTEKKQESGSGSAENEYTKELRNLSILNELKHPNIIELLTSYTYKGKHNLIFPFVEGGNLESLLNKERIDPFLLDETFLTALCGLSSAIEKVHYYALERLNIELIGCHYDLKPQNILVSGGTFVLADFGLSKLKGSNEHPKDLYEGGGGNYLAPECQDDGKGFMKNAISRSSDIWSFGCVLTEILTHMRYGADGVADFRLKRKVKIGSRRMSAFHAGIRKSNLMVLNWLQELEAGTTVYSKPLVRLIKSMLNLDPASRPDARQVASTLQGITVQTYYSSVHDLYAVLLSKLPDSFEAYAESKRLSSWGVIFGSIASEANNSWISKLTDRMDLVSIYNCLKKVQEELRSTILRCENALSPLFSSLRLFGDELYGLLPRDLEMRAKGLWEIEMVSSENLNELLKTYQAAGTVSNRISTLARIKRMSILAAEHHNQAASNLRVDPQFVKNIGPCSRHTHALVRSTLSSPERHALIEWIRYSNHETAFFEKLVARIEALAALLNSANPADFRILHCSGFVHEGGEGAFGLIFDFPRQSGLSPTSLADVISKSLKVRERPTLQSRFQLASTLALSLFGFHKVGWLHKSISPYNVLFFINMRTTRMAHWLENPHMIGFNHSRQDDALAYTLGPDDDKITSRYYHPDYSQKTAPQVLYRLEFDYYSLGLVLLEIGIWDSLDNMLKGKDFASNSEMLKQLQEKRVPLLGHFMGTNYQEAVQACLDGLNGSSPSDKGKNAELQFKFEKQVVEKLRQCSV
ncbi:hypothetical protein DRE_03411 [Drechslerella stenobrocha 248]|uniref:Protein kinase domain-containing protein n=1 Tax=Drechslerella stenobrocha 248 TaxID=1043628 RepID=W7I4B8_9PEZI|nr:hypothetical protein DRE_03411 [Drechslerella stenobrocha 248]